MVFYIDKIRYQVFLLQKNVFNCHYIIYELLCKLIDIHVPFYIT